LLTYSQSSRAKSFNEKKLRLRLLRQKATDRNPDEFYFGMIRAKTKDGVKISERGNQSLSAEVVSLLKTQDSGYLRTMLNKTRRERERLEENFQLCEKRGEGKLSGELTTLKESAGKEARNHTVFVDDEVMQKEFVIEEWFGTDEAGIRRAYNRPRKTSNQEDNFLTDGQREQSSMPVKNQKSQKQRTKEAEHQAWKDERALQKKREHVQEVRRSRMEAVKAREKDLFNAAQELDLQRAKMNNTVGGINKNGVKFKVRERKR